MTPTSARSVHYEKHESGKPRGVLGAIAAAASFLGLLCVLAVSGYVPALLVGFYAPSARCSLSSTGGTRRLRSAVGSEFPRTHCI